MFTQGDLPDFGRALRALCMLATIGLIAVLVLIPIGIAWLLNHVHVSF